MEDEGCKYEQDDRPELCERPKRDQHQGDKKDRPVGDLDANHRIRPRPLNFPQSPSRTAGRTTEEDPKPEANQPLDVRTYAHVTRSNWLPLISRPHLHTPHVPL